MYGIDIACCHQISFGAVRPKMTEPRRLVFDDPPRHFDMDLQVQRRQDGDQDPSKERSNYLIEIVVSNIKHLSHPGRKKDEIVKWITSEYDRIPAEDMMTFVQKIPLAVLVLITKGLGYFGE
jgi:hypothetical protein